MTLSTVVIDDPTLSISCPLATRACNSPLMMNPARHAGTLCPPCLCTRHYARHSYVDPLRGQSLVDLQRETLPSGLPLFTYLTLSVIRPVGR